MDVARLQIYILVKKYSRRLVAYPMPFNEPVPVMIQTFPFNLSPRAALSSWDCIFSIRALVVA